MFITPLIRFTGGGVRRKRMSSGLLGPKGPKPPVGTEFSGKGAKLLILEGPSASKGRWGPRSGVTAVAC